MGAFSSRKKAAMAQDLIAYKQQQFNKKSAKLNFPDWIPRWDKGDREALLSVDIDLLRTYIFRQSDGVQRCALRERAFT